ncbi:hypothetical protein ACIRRH_41250 [Kitasatospora sp. NPDC101235]|uniref:hypothetical protein n=1 Tax=Kitasatospora sp. NPDC101235 TaxID=3364101 RepID=UPI00380AD73A
MTEPLDLDAIQARLDAATDGPWTVDDSEIEADIIAASAWIARTDNESSEDRANAEFIAAARTDVEQLLARVRELAAERDRYRTAWYSAKARASTARELLDITEHGRDCAVEAVEQLQATLNEMPRCGAPHPVVDDARCDLIMRHPGWHAGPVGAWPGARFPWQRADSWPTTPQADAPSGPAQPAYWLAQYDGADPTLWTTEAAALDHCASLARAEGLTSWDWTPEDGAQQMIRVHPDTDAPLSRGPGRVTEIHPQTAEESPTRPA